MTNFTRATLMLIAVSAVGCAQANRVYDAVGPPEQYDHEQSEFGLAAFQGLEDPASLKKIDGTEYSAQNPRKLNLDRKTYLILQVDGGGIMGITPALLIEKIESALQQRSGFSNGKLRDVLSLSSGTSTGAIIAGGIAAGIPATEMANFYTGRACELFQRKNQLPWSPLFQNKLNRELFQAEMVRMLNSYSDYSSTVRLGEMSSSPSVIVAGYDLVSKRTVFLRNHDDPDSAVNTRDIQLIDAISASALSAAIYFGQLPAPQVLIPQIRADGKGYITKGAVWADGGQGTQNTTVALAAIEALRIKMAEPESQVVLISLGCGNDFAEREFNEVLKFRAIDHLTDYFITNQARSESILLQWMAAEKIGSIVDDLKLFRFDWDYDNPKDASSFSVNEKQRQFLIDKADEIAERPDFQQLMKDLSNNRLRFSQYQRP
jgi:hypothetical protein